MIFVSRSMLKAGLGLLLMCLITVPAVDPTRAGTALAVQDFNSLSGETRTTDSLPSGSPLTNSGSSNNDGTQGMTFETFWFQTRSNATGPTTDGELGDFIGVNRFTAEESPDVAPDGTPVADGVEQNFQFEDTDGRADLIFGSVNTVGYANRQLSLNYWINDTNYESTDSFLITLSDGSSTETLLDLAGDDLEGAASPDNGQANWQTLTVNLETLTALGTNLTLIVSVDTNASNETIFIDNILFEGDLVIPEVALNEIVVNTTGTDYEFFELSGTPGTDLSTLTLIEVRQTGDIADVINFEGHTIPASGFFLGASPAAQAQYGVTPDLMFADNTLTNQTTSYFLVHNFIGSSGQALDEDGNGAFEVTPWDQTVDEVAFLERDGEVTYATPVFGPDVTDLDSFIPAGAYRCPDGVTGSFLRHVFATIEVEATPGAANNCDSTPPPPSDTAPLTIMKIANPATTTDRFSFAGDLGPFELGSNESLTFEETGEGPITITELKTAGSTWALISAICEVATPPPTADINPSAIAIVEPEVLETDTAYQIIIPFGTPVAGETRRCTFTNEQANVAPLDEFTLFLPIIVN